MLAEPNPHASSNYSPAASVSDAYQFCASLSPFSWSLCQIHTAYHGPIVVVGLGNTRHSIHIE